MEQRELSELISKLRNMDKTNDFKGKSAILEHSFKSGNEKNRELITSCFNRLANEIADELELQKKGF